jgi:aminoglycoside phosphotransferase (APT) family kinase protein
MREDWERSFPRIEISGGFIKKIFKKLFPKSIVSYNLIKEGLINTNFKIDLEDSKDSYLLRVYTRPEACPIEAKILDLLKEKLPVPEVITYYPQNSELDAPYSYMVQKWIDGISLYKIMSDNKIKYSTKLNLTKQIAEILAKIHSIRFEKSGFFDKDLNIDEELILDKTFYIETVNNLLESEKINDRLNKNNKKSIKNFLDQYLPELDNIGGQKSLVHADFNSNNILVEFNDKNNGFKISGILDWEYALVSTPLFDIGNYFRFEDDLHNSYILEFIKIYQSIGDTLPNSWRILIRMLDLIPILQILNRNLCGPRMQKDLIHFLARYE